ncbi:hypothetical protein ABT158_29870 [Nonomuraea sp. NPDC001636]|uniref:hypothetical protein n=1 Tax=Nonomuraea sp. NPDC001636 TaxID=3154391 RepID=UPI00332D0FDB
MGLRGWLLRQAALRPRVLLVACPYGTGARLLVEAEADRRGWPVAASAAEASLMVVCGRPGAELAAAVGEVWRAVPVPRALVELPPDVPPGDVVAALDDAVHVLGDEPGQWRQAGVLAAGTSADDTPMAGRGADRDRLKLDRLHVPLGPVLADWPAGLVVETVLQGDVIQEAHVRTLPADGTGDAFWAPEPDASREEARRRTAAARLDGLGRLLGVAGWPAAAADARRLRDRLLAGAVDERGRRRCVRFTRRVRRSWVLRWMLRGAGDLGPGAPQRLRGDTLDRARRWLDDVDALTEEDVDALTEARSEPGDGGDVPVDEVLALLPGLLTGAELAVARLIVAGLDPDLDRLPSAARDG